MCSPEKCPVPWSLALVFLLDLCLAKKKIKNSCSQMIIQDNMCSRFILITWRECRKIIKKNIKIYGKIYKEKNYLSI